MTVEGHRARAVARADPGSTAVERAWLIRFSLAWFGFWTADLVPVQLLLPDQLARIDPASKVRDFAVVNLVAAVVALVALPLLGTACDRVRTGLGRRRVFVAGGAVVFAAGLLGTGLQDSWGGLVGWWAFSQLGLSAVVAGLTAVVADRVPEQQRGLVSSAIFGPQALGVVVGVGVVATLGLTSFEGYAVVAGLLLVGCAVFVRGYVEAPVTAPPLRLRSVVASLRIDPHRHPDFAWAFGGRLLVNLGNSLAVCYLLYFLTDELRVDDPEGTLLALTVVYLAAGVLLTYAAGVYSDRLERRRVFVAAGAALQAVAGLLLAVAPTLGVAFVSAALLGGGFGAYMAVDQALITQVLPAAESRAQDLGIMNIGTIVPPAVAPALAGVFITSLGGYPVMFAVVGVVVGVGAVLVYRIRSVR